MRRLCLQNEEEGHVEDVDGDVADVGGFADVVEGEFESSCRHSARSRPYNVERSTAGWHYSCRS